MKLDITWTITAVIAVSSFLSPIIVAIINNNHQLHMRNLELSHEKFKQQMDLQQQVSIKQFDIYYSDKKSAFSEFLKMAGQYRVSNQRSGIYSQLQSSIQNALLFCNIENQKLLSDFLVYANDIFGVNQSPDGRKQYSELLKNISISLNNELSLTKPIIDCKCGKH